MRTCLPDESWDLHTHENGGQLRLKGRISLSIQALMDILSQGKFPSDVQGDFAFIWQGTRSEIYAVDHLASIPLFFDTNFISTSYSHIRNASKSSNETNAQAQNEIQILGGFSLGEHTNVKDLFRVPANHYFDGERFIRYANLPPPSRAATQNLMEVRDRFFSRLEELAQRRSVLFLSSGNDSWNIFEVIRFLGLEKKFTFLHLHSQFQVYSERKFLTSYFECHSNLLYLEFDVEYSGFKNDDPDRNKFFDFWIENPFGAKYRAARHFDFYGVPLVTGEIGTGEFHGSKIRQAALQLHGHPLKLSKLLVLSLATHGRVFGHSDELIQRSVRTKLLPTFEKAVDYFRKKIELYDPAEILSWAPLIWSEEVGSFRLFHYSQDDRFTWTHPYAEANFFHAAINRRTVSASENKAFYSEVFPPTSGGIHPRRPKLGLSIPAYEKIRSLHVR